MSFEPQQFIQFVIVAAVFGLVMFVWLIGVLWWSARRSARQQHLQERLRFREPREEHTRVLRLWKDGEEATTTVPKGTVSLTTRLNKMCRDAGWEVPIHTVLLGLVGACALALAASLVFTGGLLLGASIAVVIVIGFRAYLERRVNKRTRLLENQIADALGLAARSLRAGHPLLASFNIVSEEMPDPVHKIFTEICQLQSMGVPLEESVRRAAAQAGNPEMKLFSTSVAIQLRSGGNLADMMDRLAYVIRDRMRLRRRVGILTAQTQLSKRVLVFLPFIMFVALNLLDPNYMAPLYESKLGHTLLFTAGIQVVLGLWAMNRLARLRY